MLPIRLVPANHGGDRNRGNQPRDARQAIGGVLGENRGYFERAGEIGGNDPGCDEKCGGKRAEREERHLSFHSRRRKTAVRIDETPHGAANRTDSK